MLMSVVINKTSYSTREYVCVGLLTAGIAVFTLGKAKAKTTEANSVFGICLLFASLALDGFTGPSQKKIQDKYSPTSQQVRGVCTHGSTLAVCALADDDVHTHPHALSHIHTFHQMMFNMNVYAILIVGVALVCTGQGTEALAFIERHPDVLPQMALFSLLSAFGQNFILVTLYRFGPLVLTTITTTRKFFTILCSVVWYGHVLSVMQWLGVSMVFSGLGLDALGKYLKKKAKLANMKTD
jgi:UDP-galactose transporter B1